MKTITFSINAYNVGNTVATTIESIIDAKECLDKIEILVIDDGSTDNTREIAEYYMQRFPEVIKVISKHNGGLGSAMNCGMSNAKGKYFKSVDGDDWINTANIRDLIDFLDKSCSDIVVSDYKNCFVRDKKEHTVCLFENMIPLKEYQIEEIIGNLELIPYHSLFYKTKMLKEFPVNIDENLFYVDTELELYPLYNARSITYLNKEIYMYRLGIEEQSVSVKSLKKNVKQLRQVYDHLEEFYLKNFSVNESNISNYVNRRINRLFCLYIKVLVRFPLCKKNYKEIVTFIKKTKLKEIYNYADMSSKTVSLLYRCPLLFYIPAGIFERVQDYKNE